MNFFEDSEVTTFFTENESLFQVGLILKDESQPVHAHRHNVFPRNIAGTSEFLFVLQGHMDITIFDEDFQNPEVFQVFKGCGVLLIGGAHAIEFSELTKLIEVKQGPYSVDGDKLYLSELDS